MMTGKPAQLTDAEWKVMRIVWQLKTCAARDVYELAGERYGWKQFPLTPPAMAVSARWAFALRTCNHSTQISNRQRLRWFDAIPRPVAGCEETFAGEI